MLDAVSDVTFSVLSLKFILESTIWCNLDQKTLAWIDSEVLKGTAP